MRYSFVRNIREKRKKEINNYELKGYILNKNNYVTNDILQININGIIFKYGIRICIFLYFERRLSNIFKNL